MSDELQALGTVSRLYQQRADEFREVLTSAAKADAAYKARRAQRILRALADGEANSHAKAETIADADEAVAELYQQRQIASATAEAHRAKLNQLREQVQNGRTFAVSGREIDKMHAEGRG